MFFCSTEIGHWGQLATRPHSKDLNKIIVCRLQTGVPANNGHHRLPRDSCLNTLQLAGLGHETVETYEKTKCVATVDLKEELDSRYKYAAYSLQ